MMNKEIFKHIAVNLNVKEWQIEKTFELFENGATIPFVARYRKEHTGNLEDVDLIKIKDEIEHQKTIITRKQSILKAISDQGALTEELSNKIENTFHLPDLEDLYLPFKRKKNTKAEIARNNGLEPLAKMIMSQKQPIELHSVASKFLTDDINSISKALEGAGYIIAEWMNENQSLRKSLRNLYKRSSLVSSKLIKGKEEEGDKYKGYFSFSEQISKITSYRVLAIFRGEEQKILRVKITPENEDAFNLMDKYFIKSTGEVSDYLKEVIKDAYKRLLHPSIETEIRKELKEKADEDSIKIFGANLKQLLMTSPLGGKRILAIDPGFRTGCKVVCLDEYGNLLNNATLMMHTGTRDDRTLARKKLATLAEQYKVEAIAVGNGTAGRETEDFVKKTAFRYPLDVFIVNENGASIYSASDIGREEFPKFDVTVRGAVSIGRRLMDPLSELVKIDPKSLGVGQYQHDVNQNLLQKRLAEVVEICVNNVGVNLNTASKYLLQHVSGIGEKTAANIIDFRNKNNGFSSRAQLLKVKGVGAKAYEQSVGFLRLEESEELLDNTSIHPENYEIVYAIAKDLNVEVSALFGNTELLSKVEVDNYRNHKVGDLTIKDILMVLEKPNDDPRTKIVKFSFSPDLAEIKDVKIGMSLPGIVENITNFGAFINIGIKEKGLVHISQICDKFISNPAEELHINQYVRAKVIDVDYTRKRIQLSLKEK